MGNFRWRWVRLPAAPRYAKLEGSCVDVLGVHLVAAYFTQVVALKFMNWVDISQTAANYKLPISAIEPQSKIESGIVFWLLVASPSFLSFLLVFLFSPLFFFSFSLLPFFFSPFSFSLLFLSPFPLLFLFFFNKKTGFCRTLPY